MNIEIAGSLDNNHDNKLTVIVPSYNKAKYIKETLDSIFMQITAYDYQIIIADDCSKDGTIEIIQEYQNNHPNKITLLTSDENQGLYKNVLRAYQITKTDYFCVLDPDDYWIDENFVQKSLDFLEKNLDYTIYATNAYKLENNVQSPYTYIKQNRSYDFQDFLNNKAILGWTGATVFRNVIFKNNVPEKMLVLENPSCEKSFRGDSFRNLIHLKEGKCYFCTNYTAVYRITNEGIWQGSSTIDQNLLNVWLFINMYKYYNEEYPELLLLSYRAFLNIKASKENCNVKNFNQLFELKHYFKKRKGIINSMLSIKSQLKYFIKDLKQAIRIGVLKRKNKYLINKKINAAKYVHIMFNDKFNKPFVDFINKNFEQSEHLFLCKRFFENFPFPEGSNVVEIKSLKGLNFSKPEKIICHSLFDNELVEFLYKNKKLLKKSYWGIWGGDLYNAKRDKINDYVRQNFKGYITDKDKNAVLEKYDIMNKNFYPVYLIPPIGLKMIEGIEKPNKNYTKIQINNSSDKSTLEMLDILSKFKDENIKITTILSYGDLGVKNEIIKKGTEIFGDKFEYLDSFISPDEYLKHLIQNDILILNQNRQQGLGNTTVSLAIGTKVFIRSDVTTYKCMKNDQMPIYDTISIPDLTFSDFIEYNDNYSRAKMYLDEDIIFKQLEEVFDAK